MGTAAAFSVALTGTDQAVRAAPCFYRGYTIAETAGAAASVRIYDNASTASGTLLATIRLTANQSVDVLHTGTGIRASAGVFVDVVSGAVEGAVRLA